ncbi:MAG: hypothetical protein AW10_00678 [Candidatus Accumulibacter appositus]|uniref:Uncharacterized protein n=1 Tax=Candidatus Accumulibacter appositus TaxID=1454003 RepID=A0A011PZB3_9PROT|nr:MAG: hypothetical protein AW10_00678 [Candidatus Accumulibacter appositus]
METEQKPVDEAILESRTPADDHPTKFSRRQALAIVGKHAVYTAPAVLAVLGATKSQVAHARVCPPDCSHT